MITLNDACIKYYYYTKDKKVNTNLLQEVFKNYLGYDYEPFLNNKINQIFKKNRGMSREVAYKNALIQTVSAATRCCCDMLKYRQEIKDKLMREPALRGDLTDEIINQMKYTELIQLRNSLGLNRRGKRVKKVEEAPAKTIAEAKAALKQESTSKTAFDAINGATQQATLQEMYPDAFPPEVFYTVEEARVAYPGASYNELLKKGIHLLEPDAKEILDRYNLIDQILLYDISIGGEPLTTASLIESSTKELKSILKMVKELNGKVKGHTK